MHLDEVPKSGLRRAKDGMAPAHYKGSWFGYVATIPVLVDSVESLSLLAMGDLELVLDVYRQWVYVCQQAGKVGYEGVVVQRV